MATPAARMDVSAKKEFLAFLDQLARVSSSTDFYTSARDKRAKAGRCRYASGRCHLLELPPELRNLIYRTIYPLWHSEKPISPLKIHNPDPRFLLSCSQIYHEARGYYEQARGHLWMDSNFLIRKQSLKATDLSKFHKFDLDLITRVTVVNDVEYDDKIMVASLIDFRGGWSISYLDNGAASIPAPPIARANFRAEYVCIHHRPTGFWKGMTWVEFLESKEKMEDSLMRMGTHASMKDQICQILMVGPEEVKRIAVRTFWRSVNGASAGSVV
ncbi:hypothetical protein AC578_6474 [Pseudocercospora eumusae]|uniref:F-box domain-containing protein n=1 Tax=Pseudocercospora eumusae TaxID=321146 RepID=A0A139HCZ8_9PEZI|nr:hypothetical protein AC578_6474 [Pseudocercospora eumusae]